MRSSPACQVPEFIHRVEGLCLTPGNKTAGFDALISTRVLKRLQALPVDAKLQEGLLRTMRERVLVANLLSRKLAERCGVIFVTGTLCPRFFVTDPELGGSIGAAPEELERLPREDAEAWIGPVLAYTAHNVDTSNQALALLVMLETWSEFVRSYLLSCSA